MPNEFDFESPLNKLLSDVIPRFAEGHLQRESQERMALEEISFRENESRLDRLQLTEEADSARKASAEQARLARVQTQQEIDIQKDTLKFNKNRAIEKDRATNDQSILESLDDLTPIQFLERTETMTLSTGIGNQTLGDRRIIAKNKVDNSLEIKGLSDLLINKRAKTIFLKKVDSGDISGAMEFFESTPNDLSPQDKIEAGFIAQNITSLLSEKALATDERKIELGDEIELERESLRELYGKKKAKDDLSLIEKKVINIMANASGISKDEFKKGGKGEALITKFAMEQGDADLSDSELIELAKIVSKKPKKTSLELFQESTREKINRKHAKKRKSDIESILELNRRAKDKGFSIDDIMMGF